MDINKKLVTVVVTRPNKTNGRRIRIDTKPILEIQDSNSNHQKKQTFEIIRIALQKVIFLGEVCCIEDISRPSSGNSEADK